jgi:hypothetical protein
MFDGSYKCAFLIIETNIISGVFFINEVITYEHFGYKVFSLYIPALGMLCPKQLVTLALP